MELKTTLVSAVIAFGASALASRVDLRGVTAAPTVAAPQAEATLAGASYASLLAELDERIERLKERAGLRADDWLIRMHLGSALLERASLSNRTEDYERVEATLAEAFQIAPAGSGPLLLAARFNYAIHRLDVAEQYLEKVEGRAVPRREDLAVARVLRAEIAVARGNYDDALEVLTAVASAEPAAATAELALYHAKTGDPGRAEALLEDMLESASLNDPRRRAWLRLQLGVVAMDRGDMLAATKHLKLADAELGGWWLVREHIAELHERRDEHAQAIAIYEELVHTADLPQHMDALAGLYRHTGRTAEAQALIARAAARWEAQIARFPEAAMGHGLQHHLQFGAPERALELALANHAARPGGEAQVALARVYLQLGRASEALELVSRTLATPYRTARLHDVAAKAYAALGRTAEAEAQISLRLAVNPWYSSDDHSH